MSLTKEYFIKKAEEMFWDSPLSDILGIKTYTELDEQTIDISRGRFKSSIIVRFSPEGEPVSSSITSNFVGPSKDELIRNKKNMIEKLQNELKEMEANKD